MSSAYLTNPLLFLVETIVGFYAAIVLLRFLLQMTRADFYNPVSQFVVKLTTPVLRPLRQMIPGYQGIDFSSLVAAWLVLVLKLMLVGMLANLDRNLLGAFLWAIPELVVLTINIFLFAVLIRVVMSWLNPDPYHPIVGLLDKLTAPVMKPAQRLIPPIGGIDLSPMAVMIGLVVLEMLLIPPLKALTATPF